MRNRVSRLKSVEPASLVINHSGAVSALDNLSGRTGLGFADPLPLQGRLSWPSRIAPCRPGRALPSPLLSRHHREAGNAATARGFLASSRNSQASFHSYSTTPSFRISARGSGCTIPSRSTTSNCRSVGVSSSTSRANAAISPPLAARSMSLRSRLSPRVRNPKRRTRAIPSRRARARILSTMSGRRSICPSLRWIVRLILSDSLRLGGQVGAHLEPHPVLSPIANNRSPPCFRRGKPPLPCAFGSDSYKTRRIRPRKTICVGQGYRLERESTRPVACPGSAGREAPERAGLARRAWGSDHMGTRFDGHPILGKTEGGSW